MKRSEQSASSKWSGESRLIQARANPEIEAPPVRALCVRVPIAARMLGVGLTKMYELIGNGEIQTVKLGRVTLVPMASLEDLIARHLSKS